MVLSCESLLELDLSSHQLALSSLIPMEESLSWSPVLPKTSTTKQSLGSVLPLTGLEGGLSSISGWLELWLTTSTALLSPVLGCLCCQTWAGQVENCVHCRCRTLLLHWSSGVLSGEQPCFLNLGSMVSMRDGSPAGVQEASMSDIVRARGSRVQAQSTGLLFCTGEATKVKAGGLLGPGEVLLGGTSAHGNMVSTSMSLTEHVGTAQGLSTVERNHMRSLTQSTRLTWERTSLNRCLTALAPWPTGLPVSQPTFPSAWQHQLKSCQSLWQSAHLPSHSAHAVQGAAPT